jgi:F-type H+-transporting ATPase subunit a
MSKGHSPLAQFEVNTLYPMPTLAGHNIDFTNASLFMVLAVAVSWIFLFFGMRKQAMVPGYWQSLVEMTYEMVAGTVRDNAGEEGKPFFPIIFTLFMFVLMCNLLGMMPYSFTVTSHIIVTFALAAFVFLGVTLIAIIKHGPLKFLGFFLPHGTPMWMAPVMYVIELFSYLSRPISLSVRLAANMLAGHILLKIVAGFIISLGLIAGWLPFGFTVMLSGFEVAVALIQAYIFTVLASIYLNDALHLH